MNTIPFNKPYLTGSELLYIQQAYEAGKLSGDGQFTKLCQTWLEQQTGARRALLTQSCTAALEMAAILLDIQPGDEIIIPSYTFVSTANAFALRGGVPVFIDVRPDNFNLDETQIVAAITPKTRAIVVVHYAGVSCEMDAIMAIARDHGLYVVEDAAQGLMASYRGKSLGSIGHLAAFSFHDTKNIISGEGGALLVNDPQFVERAEVIREKGTNRSQFLRGEVDKYTWQDIGSSFLPSEITAAVLWAQLQAAEEITQKRKAVWDHYHDLFMDLELTGQLRRPIIPSDCDHNAHMYYLLFSNLSARLQWQNYWRERGIQTAAHYVPLHQSPAAKKLARSMGSLPNSVYASECLLRMPLWVGLESHFQTIVDQMPR